MGYTCIHTLMHLTCFCNILHFSLPVSLGLSLDHYIHRIGRCGRAGQSGIAHTFFVTDWDAPHAPSLVTLLEQAKQHVPRELVEIATVAAHKQAKKGNVVTGDAAYVQGEEEEDEEDEVFTIPGNRSRQQHVTQKGKQPKGKGRGRGRGRR